MSIELGKKICGLEPAPARSEQGLRQQQDQSSIQEMHVSRTRVLMCGVLLFATGPLVRQNTNEKLGSAPSTSSPSQPGLEAKLTFKDAGRGEFAPKDGVSLSFHGFIASDGVGLTAIYGSFASESLAEAQFEKEVAKAAKIVRRDKKKDKLGTVVGERAEIMTLADDGRTVPAILWTFGSKYHEIMSASERDNLALEKKYELKFVADHPEPKNPYLKPRPFRKAKGIGHPPVFTCAWNCFRVSVQKMRSEGWPTRRITDNISNY
jgi:hypothetical protein